MNYQNFMVYHLHKVQYEYVDYGEDFGLLSLGQIKQEDHLMPSQKKKHQKQEATVKHRLQ